MVRIALRAARALVFELFIASRIAGGPPMGAAHGLASPGNAYAPLVGRSHLLADFVAVFACCSFRERGSEEFPHFDWARSAVLLRLPAKASPGKPSHLLGERSLFNGFVYSPEGSLEAVRLVGAGNRQHFVDAFRPGAEHAAV